jgi:hypothetical protein
MHWLTLALGFLWLAFGLMGSGVEKSIDLAISNVWFATALILSAIQKNNHT